MPGRGGARSVLRRSCRLSNSCSPLLRHPALETLRPPHLTCSRRLPLLRHATVHSVAAPPGLPRRARPGPLLPERPPGGSRPPRPQRQQQQACAYLGDDPPATGAGARPLLAARAAPQPRPAQGPPPAWQAFGSLLAAGPGEGAPSASSASGAAARHRAAAAAAAAAVVAELHAAARAAGKAADGRRAAATGDAEAAAVDGGPPAAAEWASRVELLRPQLRALSPDQLADLAWALSRLGLDPGPAWLEELMAAAAARLGERRFRGYTFATLLPALGALRATPCRGWLAACLHAAAGKADRMWPRELAAAAAGLPPLLRAARGGDGGALLAGSGWGPAFFESSGRQLDRFEPLGLARALHAAAQLSAEFGAAPPADWLAGVSARLAAAAADRRLGPREVAMSLQALALLWPRRRPAAGAGALDGGGFGEDEEEEEALDEEERSGMGTAAAAAVAAALGAAPGAAAVAGAAPAPPVAGEQPPQGLPSGGAAAEAEVEAALCALRAALEAEVASNAAAFGPEELSTALLALANLRPRTDWLWLHSVLSAAQVRGRGHRRRQRLTGQQPLALGLWGVPAGAPVRGWHLVHRLKPKSSPCALLPPACPPPPTLHSPCSRAAGRGSCRHCCPPPAAWCAAALRRSRARGTRPCLYCRTRSGRRQRPPRRRAAALSSSSRSGRAACGAPPPLGRQRRSARRWASAQWTAAHQATVAMSAAAPAARARLWCAGRRQRAPRRRRSWGASGRVTSW
jgi:hypothetical protein